MAGRTMSDTASIQAFVRNHPKLIGVLFALMFLLSQASTVAASAHTFTTGP